MRPNSRRTAFAVFLAAAFALLIGLLANIATNTIEVANPWIVWLALGIVFVASLPVSLYLVRVNDPPTPPLTDPERIEPVPPPLPQKLYNQFFGRERVIDEIMQVLREPKRRTMIGIDGMGGIGKTSLAHEITTRCLKEALFDFILWESKSTEGALSRNSSLTWSELLVTLGRQLGSPDIQRLTDEKKEQRLTELFLTQRVLLVLDNLETATVQQDEITMRLAPLLSSSKAILTSRRRFKGNIYGVHLGGLDEESAIQLLRYEAREKGIAHIADAASHDLRTIAIATGGSPLALKLVGGQLQYVGMDILLGALQKVRLVNGESNEDEYVQFYKHIFWNSWQLLSRNAQELLVALAALKPNIGGDIELVKATSDMDETTLLALVSELWRFSFVEIGKTNVQTTRYFLHPLTHNFVLSEIVAFPPAKGA